MDNEQLIAVVAQIPKGHWASYGDVAHAARSNPRALNQMFERGEIPGSHRVLRSDGSISASVKDPAEVRRLLEEEGLEFHDGKALPAKRVEPVRVPAPAPPAAEEPEPAPAEAAAA